MAGSLASVEVAPLARLALCRGGLGRPPLDKVSSLLAAADLLHRVKAFEDELTPRDECFWMRVQFELLGGLQKGRDLLEDSQGFLGRHGVGNANLATLAKPLPDRQAVRQAEAARKGLLDGLPDESRGAGIGSTHP